MGLRHMKALVYMMPVAGNQAKATTPMPPRKGESAEPTMNKSQLLTRIEEERVFWERLLAEVGEERMEQPGATGDWTFKDVVAHLVMWRQRTIAQLEAAQRNQPPAPPLWPAFLDEEKETEQINHWIYLTNQDRPLQDILNESRRQFQQLATLVTALSEQDLMDPKRFAWMKGQALGPAISTFGHLHEEHEPALRAWLARSNKQAAAQQSDAGKQDSVNQA